MIPISSLSTQYLMFNVSGVYPDGTMIDPTSDAVDFAIVLAGTDIAANAPTWTSGSWYSGAGAGFYAQILVGPGTSVPLTEDTAYDVWIRIHDNPEVPVLLAGSFSTR